MFKGSSMFIFLYSTFDQNLHQNNQQKQPQAFFTEQTQLVVFVIQFQLHIKVELSYLLSGTGGGTYVSTAHTRLGCGAIGRHVCDIAAAAALA